VTDTRALRLEAIEREIVLIDYELCSLRAERARAIRAVDEHLRRRAELVEERRGMADATAIR